MYKGDGVKKAPGTPYPVPLIRETEPSINPQPLPHNSSGF